jgi:hypothetical protein
MEGMGVLCDDLSSMLMESTLMRVRMVVEWMMDDG